jgi:hypothetical protein
MTGGQPAPLRDISGQKKDGAVRIRAAGIQGDMT